MKKNKRAGFLALLLCGSVLCLSACTDSGKTNFQNGWNKDTNIEVGLVETAYYKVSSFEGSSSTYGVSYDGVYKTELKHITFDDGTNGYEYSTYLHYDVTFTLGTEAKTFDNEFTYDPMDENATPTVIDATSIPSNDADYCITKVKFKEARNGLTPISSEKQLSSHTPRDTAPTKIENCWGDKVVAYKTVIEYGENNKATYTYIQGAENFGKTYDEVAKENKKTAKFNYSGDKLSYLDNEQLMLAFRAIDKEETSATVASYSPLLGERKYKFSFENSSKNESFTYALDGEKKKEKSLAFRKATLSLSAKQSGPSYTVKVAKQPDNGINENRNIILEIQTPLSYNIGTIVYKLAIVNYTK